MSHGQGLGGPGVARWRDGSGQSTVEYALIIMAFASMLIALGSLWHAGRDGALVDRAVRSSSHQLGGADALGSLRDVVLY